MFGKPNAKTDRMPGLLEAPDRLVGVIVGVHDVRPVDERRDARVGALERAPQVGGVDVVGPVVRRELVEDPGEVRAQRVVRGARPDRRLPRVAVGVDEARDDDVALGVDDLGALGREVRPDGGDRVAFDEDVGLGSSPRDGSWVRTMPLRISIRSATAMLPFSLLRPVGPFVGSSSPLRARPPLPG